MSSDFEELQRNWESSKQNIESQSGSFDDLYKKIKRKEKENFSSYYGTIIILSITLLVISLFFYYAAPVEKLLSRIGAGLMILGLMVRIIIEIISIYKAKRIDNLDSTLTTAENTIKFHQFRKLIHLVVTPIIIGLYTIGFYIITPEFSLYLKPWNVALIDVSYIIIGVILFIIIRKQVKEEMKKLRDIVDLRNEITGEKSSN